MSLIHPTAIIDASAKIDPSVSVGPFSVIGPKVVIGKNTAIAAHVVIEGFTTIGQNCTIAPQAVIGGLPQDLNFGGEESFVTIGDNVNIRECVTINRATGEGQATIVEDNAFIMAYSHLAHNCKLGTSAILANNVQLAGYVEVGEKAFISGSNVFHQFVRVGRLSIISGASGTRQDIPPFSMCDGRPAIITGLNRVGLKRAGFSLEDRNVLKKAYQLLWFSGLSTHEAIAQIRQEFGSHPLSEELITFVETSKRGIHPARQPHLTGPDHNLETEDTSMLKEASEISV